MSDFQTFINAAKERDQNIILEIDPNHSSDKHPWFIKSEEKEEPYTSYYIWADGKERADGKELLPPNNWVK